MKGGKRRKKSKIKIQNIRQNDKGWFGCITLMKDLEVLYGNLSRLLLQNNNRTIEKKTQRCNFVLSAAILPLSSLKLGHITAA